MSLRAAVPVTAHHKVWDARDPKGRELHPTVHPIYAAWTGNPPEGWAATRSFNE